MLDYLGLDWGERFFGLAFGDIQTGLIIADQKECTQENIWQRLEQIIIQKKIKVIVIGIPTNFHLQKTKVTEQVLEFVTKLQSTFPTVKVETINERNSTKMIKSAGKISNRQQLNHEAAAQILRFFMEQNSLLYPIR